MKDYWRHHYTGSVFRKFQGVENVPEASVGQLTRVARASVDFCQKMMALNGLTQYKYTVPLPTSNGMVLLETRVITDAYGQPLVMSRVVLPRVVSEVEEVEVEEESKKKKPLFITTVTTYEEEVEHKKYYGLDPTANEIDGTLIGTSGIWRLFSINNIEKDSILLCTDCDGNLIYTPDYDPETDAIEFPACEQSPTIPNEVKETETGNLFDPNLYTIRYTSTKFTPSINLGRTYPNDPYRLECTFLGTWEGHVLGNVGPYHYRRTESLIGKQITECPGRSSSSGKVNSVDLLDFKIDHVLESPPLTIVANGIWQGLFAYLPCDTELDVQIDYARSFNLYRRKETFYGVAGGVLTHSYTIDEESESTEHVCNMIEADIHMLMIAHNDDSSYKGEFSVFGALVEEAGGEGRDYQGVEGECSGNGVFNILSDITADKSALFAFSPCAFKQPINSGEDD